MFGSVRPRLQYASNRRLNRLKLSGNGSRRRRPGRDRTRAKGSRRRNSFCCRLRLRLQDKSLSNFMGGLVGRLDRHARESSIRRNCRLRRRRDRSHRGGRFLGGRGALSTFRTFKHRLSESTRSLPFCQTVRGIRRRKGDRGDIRSG